MTTTRRPGLRERLNGLSRIVLKEIAAFGLVGAISFAIDLGLFTWLRPDGALKAKIVSTVVSTTVAYFGNRYFSFSHRARSGVGRETAFFFGINVATLAFSLAAIALFVYPLHFGHQSTVVFFVNLATIAVSSVFRFWAYKRFVFLHPDRVHRSDVDLAEELAE